MELSEILNLTHSDLEKVVAEQERTLHKLLSDDPDFARLAALDPKLMP